MTEDYVKWPSDTAKGFMEAHEGDGLVMSRPTLARGTVQPQTAPTLTCGTGGGTGVVTDIPPITDGEDTMSWPDLTGMEEVKDGDGVVPSRPYSVRKSSMDGMSFSTAASAVPGVCVKTDIPPIQDGDVVAVATPGRASKDQNGRRFKDPGEESFTVTATDPNGIAKMDAGKLRIRYLTERECLRLMGQSDEAIDRIFAAEPTKTARYRFAGNSIVVDVLVAIFKGIYIDGTFVKPKPKQKGLEDFL